jgi:hypothetical protein
MHPMHGYPLEVYSAENLNDRIKSLKGCEVPAELRGAEWHMRMRGLGGDKSDALTRPGQQRASVAMCMIFSPSFACITSGMVPCDKSGTEGAPRDMADANWNWNWNRQGMQARFATTLALRATNSISQLSSTSAGRTPPCSGAKARSGLCANETSRRTAQRATLETF